MYNPGSVTFDIGDNKPIKIETGKLALLANAAVTVTQGETVVLVTVCCAKPREGTDFFPLQVAYREKFSSAGRIPGGYIKRENRPGDHEVLVSRMTDRPIRPLFPKGFFHDVQIQAICLSYDGVHEPDTLAMLGSSAALMLSDLPFAGPTGSLRVGLVNGQFVANPTAAEMKKSSLELIYAGVPGKAIMIEGDADELSEEQLLEAMKFADTKVLIMAAAQKELASKYGKAKKDYPLTLCCEKLVAAIKDATAGKLDAPCLIVDKTERSNALSALLKEVSPAIIAKLGEENCGDLKGTFEHVVSKNIRRLILEEGKRSDGRGISDLRPLFAEAPVLPRTHGSALFARGETQGVITVTLGSGDDVLESDRMAGNFKKNFYLHYNFPNFSVGECGRIGAPGNREIGHGNLAERSLAKMMPANYPYTVRVISEIMGSNGSTSMASICGGSLALFDAGIPLKKAVAGISCGLVTDENAEDYLSHYKLITDIIGSEDHYGDMDFKVAGTRDGITGFQLDLKVPGIPLSMMYDAMLRDKEARMKILDVMDACLAAPRETVSPNAPQMQVVNIRPDKIGALIGTGGKNIKSITESTGAKIDIEDDGRVTVFAINATVMAEAVRQIKGFTFELEIGKIYRGVVAGIKEFGAFVEIEGQSGLLHISELADYRVARVEDIVQLGDKISVKVLDMDDRGRIKLSRRAALAEMESQPAQG